MVVVVASLENKREPHTLGAQMQKFDSQAVFIRVCCGFTNLSLQHVTDVIRMICNGLHQHLVDRVIVIYLFKQ